MKAEKNILIAFVLNLSFSLFEFFGGIYTGSVAVLSDAVHDLGDAASIGLAYFLEKKSKKEPGGAYTYGCARWSVLGSVITTLILLVGSALVIAGAVRRMISPRAINYDGMILFALVGAAVNVGAAFVTREGASLNQRAVNLHMLEDALGWVVVLAGALVMRFTDFVLLDPLLSIGVALFILVHAAKALAEAIEVLLEKAPHGVDEQALTAHLSTVDGVLGVHHVHLWSMDGQNCYATMHIVTNGDARTVKARVREELREHGIAHATLELEAEGEECCEKHCHVEHVQHGHHHHHHH